VDASHSRTTLCISIDTCMIITMNVEITIVVSYSSWPMWSLAHIVVGLYGCSMDRISFARFR
jgi:hypothetical protein